MHALLRKQLMALNLEKGCLPDAKTWDQFLSGVDEAYGNSEQTAKKLENALQRASKEVLGLSESLKSNQNELKLAHEQFDTVLGVVPTAVCGISRAGEVLFMNEQACKLLKILYAKHMLHQPVMEVDAYQVLSKFKMDGQGLTVELLFHQLLEENFRSYMDCKLTSSDSDLDIILHLSAPKNAESRNFVVMSFQDISESLSDEREDVKEHKMQAMSSLIGGISHELNNMLAVITGNLFLAKSRVRENDDSINWLKTAEKFAYDMGDVIAHLMAFSGQSVLALEVLDFKALVSKEVGEFVENAPDNVRMELDLCDYNLELFGAEEQLQQLVVHIIKNAMDAMTKTSVPMIKVSLEHVTANAAFCKKHQLGSTEHFAKLSIVDNGMGISDEVLPRIFEPFFTGKAIGEGEGRGLGLSMVQGTVQMHHGVIEVDTHKDEGTRIDVYLPLNEQKEEVNEVVEKSETAVGKAILLVEDDAFLQSITSELLVEMGYEVITADDGLEAIEVYERRQKDIGLILMDIMMPRMDGTTAWLRIRELNPHAKVVFASGYDRNRSKLEELGLQDERFLIKPYNITELCDLIESDLGSNL